MYTYWKEVMLMRFKRYRRLIAISFIIAIALVIYLTCSSSHIEFEISVGASTLHLIFDK